MFEHFKDDLQCSTDIIHVFILKIIDTNYWFDICCCLSGIYLQGWHQAVSLCWPHTTGSYRQ